MEEEAMTIFDRTISGLKDSVYIREDFNSYISLG